jgi:hypothetical protein
MEPLEKTMTPAYTQDALIFPDHPVIESRIIRRVPMPGVHSTSSIEQVRK